MFHRLVKEAYFNKLKGITNFDGSSFYFLPKEFHDITLNFNTRLYQYITEESKDLNLTKSNKKWIGILWHRSPVGASAFATEYKTNRFLVYNNDENNPSYDSYRFKFMAVAMEFALYSNDPDYLEDYEHNLFLDVPVQFPIKVTYPILGGKNFTGNISNHQLNSVVKEPRENFGTLTKLQISCVFNYVVPKFEGIIKGIKEVKFDFVIKNQKDEIMHIFQH